MLSCQGKSFISQIYMKILDLPPADKNCEAQYRNSKLRGTFPRGENLLASMRGTFPRGENLLASMRGTFPHGENLLADLRGAPNGKNL
jgi:hypothetical protein